MTTVTVSGAPAFSVISTPADELAVLSTLTVSLASGTNTYAGVIGGAGANENAVALTKTGAGILILG